MINNLLFVGFGSLITLLILMFIGWVDVAFMNKPLKEIRNDKPILTYMIASAWEGLFLLMGIIIGVLFF